MNEVILNVFDDVAYSPSIGALASSLAKAQAQIEGASRDSSNPFFKSKFADLATCADVCRVPLSSNGIALVQLPSAVGLDISLTTMLIHTSGEWIRSKLTMKAADSKPQTFGSCITYLRRYAMCAVVGIYQIDDDGNSASGKVTVQSATQANPFVKAPK